MPVGGRGIDGDQGGPSRTRPRIAAVRLDLDQCRAPRAAYGAGKEATMSPSAIEERWLARLTPALGVVIALAGTAVLGGWTFDVPALKSVLPGLATMKANTALGFVLLGTALWSSGTAGALASPRARARLATTCASLLGLLGLLTLAEYAFDWNPGFDQWLFRDDPSSPGTAAPGRMAQMTAINFTLLAAALLLLGVESRRGFRPSNWLALLVCTNAYLAMLGYAYGVSELYAVAAMSSVALHTAVLFALAGAAVACARHGSRLCQQVVGDNMASQVNRRLLPIAILLPPVLGWLSLQGGLSGLYPERFALAMFTVANAAVFAVLVWRSSRALQQQHDQRLAVAQVSAWQRAILDSADLTVIATDTAGRIVSVNAGAVDKLGYAPDELVGKTPLVIHDAREVAERAKVLSDEFGQAVAPGFEVFVAKARRGGSDENDWTYVRKDGSTFPVRLSVTTLRDARGEPTGFLGIGTDITRRKQAEAQLLYLARFDSLTGLANRSHVLEALGEAIARCERDGHPLALVFLDLDRFKPINDRFGHHAGDLVLQEFARRLSRSVRATDTVARLAGDEFVIVLDLLHEPADAAAVAEKIAAAMREPFRILGQDLVVSTSMGIAVRRPGETDPEALLRRADAALYRAKASNVDAYRIES
jgi:diguanylate cyclase (GGDEF)-like protein/PAS domain S-box-containing protein